MCFCLAGLDAQQAVVFAQLGIGGRSFGVHGFLVPLRDQVICLVA